jgi:hypothetical protein
VPANGPKSPLTVTNVVLGGESWDTPSNASASDNIYTTATNPSFPYTSDYLKCTNFQFNIPSNAIILGIVVEIERFADIGSSVQDYRIRIVKGGTIGSTDKSAGGYWSTSEAYYSYGSSVDLWGETWTPADINSSNFGVAIAVTGGPLAYATIDHVRITVYATLIGDNVLNFTGFETGSSGLIEGSLHGIVSIQSIFGGGTGIRTGFGALRTNPTSSNNGWFLLKGLDLAGYPSGFNTPTCFNRFYFRYATKPSSNSEEIFAATSNSSGTIFTLRINSAGNLLAYDSNLSQISSGSPNTLSSNIWYRVESNIDKTGVCEVQLNGSTEITGSGAIVANIDNLYFGKVTNRNNNSVDFFYDDISVTDDGWIGPGYCILRQPWINGDFSNWGRDWSDLYSAFQPNIGTDRYIFHPSSPSPFQITTGFVEPSDPVVSGQFVNAIKPFLVCGKTGGTNGAFQIVTRSGHTNYTTNSFRPTSYGIGNQGAFLGKIWTVDPYSSGNLGSPGLLDQVQAGVYASELPTGFNELKVIQAGITLDVSTRGNILVSIMHQMLHNRQKVLLPVTNNKLQLNKKRLSVSLRNIAKTELIILTRRRLKRVVRAVTQMSVAIATLSKLRLRSIQRSITTNGKPSYPCTGQIPLFIAGATNKVVTNSIPLYLNCISSSYSGVYNSIPLSLSGVIATSSGNIPLYIKGDNGLASGNIPLYISGPITSGVSTGSIPLFINCNWPNRRIPLYIRGSGLTPNSPDGAISANNSIPLYLHSPGADIRLPLYLKTIEGTSSGTITMYTTGVLGVTSSGIPLYMYGYENSSIRIPLFTKGF